MSTAPPSPPDPPVRRSAAMPVVKFPEKEKERSAATTASAIAAVLFLGIVARFGWLSDDAFISFHAVDNLISGHGLVSNVGERVQAFTNPLWTLLLAAPLAATGDIYNSALVLSLLCNLGLVVAVWRLHRGGWPAVWTLLLLSTSFGFISFSTSGLENPLAHLLLVLFFVVAFREPVSLAQLWLLGGLVILNRMDHALLVLPILVVSLRSGKPIAWRSVALGIAPLVAWLMFALVYYGFAYPNTAYAKLNVAIGRDLLLAQGLTYLVDNVLTDLLVLPTIVLAVVGAVWARPRSRNALAIGGGIAAYLLYICWVGGDFMSGRFLTAPFLLAVLLLSVTVHLHPRGALALSVVALFAGQRLLLPLPVDVTTHCPVPPSGVVDERACYVEHTGIAQNLRTKKFKRHPYFLEGLKLQSSQRRVAVSSLVGMGGFAAGPGAHLIDPYALTDPLLARIRYKPAGDWRPGHMLRPLPDGYVLSVEQGQNVVKDPCIHALLDDIWLITRGPLFTGARWKAIFRRNLTARTCPQPNS
jgi:arabinofuranosyltransferase